ncbi:biogenesis of lysosome-related organelles complex 1 subunit 6 [Sitophilus oryzae]|uniref:Biogenesis of lysosome-related organelles complex 1 subunit 6 n=1 Tax=Sitophilus oryzae TaxID=7048 RepID=A0A6J2YNP3_SITOR|nr:biogenesis of lysosome-related organelles complex 1 subunit 6 [Sitophilus oryzae]
MAGETEKIQSDALHEENLYEGPVRSVTKGFVNLLEPPLKEVRRQLNELQETQAKLYEKIHEENLILSNIQHSMELQGMLNKMKIYNSKLKSIKKNIRGIHERSTKLKKRAIRLQQLKQNEVGEIIVNPPENK